MTTILVDLDGTITDPARGIIGAFRHALEQMGCNAPPHDELGWVIGPPLRKSFPRLLQSGMDPEEAIRHYRSHYGAGGIFNADVYSGIPEALAMLRTLADRMYVCTAKPASFAQPIIEHFGLSAHFDKVYGPDLEGRLDDKGDLIAHMVEAEGFDPARAVMIGDRDNDVRAARRHGIPAIGVLWGYGGREELDAAGASRICTNPSELVQHVRSVLPE